MDEPSLWGVIGLIVVAILSGFFSTAQAALSNVRRQSLREMVEKGNNRAKLALTLVEESFRLLKTFELANLFTHYLMAGLLALVALPPLAAWLSGITPLSLPASYALSYLVVLPVAALLAYIFFAIIPEILVQRDPVAWAIRIARTARIAAGLFNPLVTLLMRAQRRIVTPLGSDPHNAALVTEEEIMTLVDAGEEEGSIEQEEKEMIYSIFQLDETLAREIMVPRIDIVALESGTSLEDAREVIINAGHSRIPIYEDSLDRIIGLLYAKDLLEVWHNKTEAVNLSELLRPALFIPESKHISDLLHELQTEKVHLAIVIDEYGGTAGLVTIEDIVEEIFGEIFDEYDEDEDATYQQLSEHEYLIDARIDLDDFNRLLNTELPDELGDTLAGFIYAKLGKVPDPGEVIETSQLDIEVKEVVDRRIGKVHVHIKPLPDAHQESDASNHAGKNGNGH